MSVCGKHSTVTHQDGRRNYHLDFSHLIGSVYSRTLLDLESKNAHTA